MATKALYRINGGEVLKVTSSGQDFADREPTIYGVLTDPVLVDGSAVRETLPSGLLGPMRVLGFAKFAVVGTNTVRNATPLEISAWAAAETADDATLDASSVVTWFAQHPRYRKAFTALIRRIISENNIQAQKWNDFRVQVAASSNLADLKSRVAAMGDLPTRTVAQGVAALLSDVSSGD